MPQFCHGCGKLKARAGVPLCLECVKKKAKRMARESAKR